MTLNRKQSWSLILALFALLAIAPSVVAQDVKTPEWPLNQDEILDLVEEALMVDTNAATVEHWQSVSVETVGWKIYAFPQYTSFNGMGITPIDNPSLPYFVEFSWDEECTAAGFIFESDIANLLVVTESTVYMLEELCDLSDHVSPYDSLLWQGHFVVE